MTQRLRVSDKDCFVEVELRTPLPFDHLRDERAEPLIRTALLLAVAALLEGGEWPTRALYALREFMVVMHDALQGKLSEE
jgi:hypothetical protein